MNNTKPIIKSYADQTESERAMDMIEVEKKRDASIRLDKIKFVVAVSAPILIGYYFGGKKGALIGGGLVVVGFVGVAGYILKNWK